MGSGEPREPTPGPGGAPGGGPEAPPGHQHPPYGTPYILVPQWQAPPQRKENVLAIVGISCAVTGVALLVISIGFMWFVSLPLSIAGLVCGLLGRQKVDRDELETGRGLAHAGFVVGIVGVALHLVALVLVVILFGALFDSLNELQLPEPERGRPGLDRSAIGAAAALVVAGSPAGRLRSLRYPRPAR